jgi:hypothetical protein
MLSVLLGMEMQIPFFLLVEEHALEGMSQDYIEKVATGMMVDCVECGQLNERNSDCCLSCGCPL